MIWLCGPSSEPLFRLRRRRPSGPLRFSLLESNENKCKSIKIFEKQITINENQWKSTPPCTSPWPPQPPPLSNRFTNAHVKTKLVHEPGHACHLFLWFQCWIVRFLWFSWFSNEILWFFLIFINLKWKSNISWLSWLSNWIIWFLWFSWFSCGNIRTSWFSYSHM